MVGDVGGREIATELELEHLPVHRRERIERFAHLETSEKSPERVVSGYVVLLRLRKRRRQRPAAPA